MALGILLASACGKSETPTVEAKDVSNPRTAQDEEETPSEAAAKVQDKPMPACDTFFSDEEVANICGDHMLPKTWRQELDATNVCQRRFADSRAPEGAVYDPFVGLKAGVWRLSSDDDNGKRVVDEFEHLQETSPGMGVMVEGIGEKAFLKTKDDEVTIKFGKGRYLVWLRSPVDICSAEQLQTLAKMFANRL